MIVCTISSIIRRTSHLQHAQISPVLGHEAGRVVSYDADLVASASPRDQAGLRKRRGDHLSSRTSHRRACRRSWKPARWPGGLATVRPGARARSRRTLQDRDVASGRSVRGGRLGLATAVLRVLGLRIGGRDERGDAERGDEGANEAVHGGGSQSNSRTGSSATDERETDSASDVDLSSTRAERQIDMVQVVQEAWTRACTDDEDDQTDPAAWRSTRRFR